MSSISHSTVDCNSTSFQPRMSSSGTKLFFLSCFVPDENLHGQNIVLLQSTVLHEMLDVTTDIWSRSHEPLSHHTHKHMLRSKNTHMHTFTSRKAHTSSHMNTNTHTSTCYSHPPPSPPLTDTHTVHRSTHFKHIIAFPRSQESPTQSLSIFIHSAHRLLFVWLVMLLHFHWALSKNRSLSLNSAGLLLQ